MKLRTQKKRPAIVARTARARQKPKRFGASFLHRGRWWVAWTDDVPGAITQGKTLAEARENLRDAISLMLEPVNFDNVPKTPDRVVREVLEL